MAKTSRNALDALLMLIDRCIKGLEENAKLRARIAELERAETARAVGVLS